MKIFIRLFISLQILLCLYVFNSLVFWIYEDNSISNGLDGYIFSELDVDDFSNFYNLFIEEYPDNKLQVIKNSADLTKESAYDYYVYPFGSISERKAISFNVEFHYYDLTLDDFVDNSGVFYTDLSKNQVESLASSLVVEIDSYDRTTISYIQILDLIGVDVILLTVVLLTVYSVYTSSSFKKIGIKKSLGFGGAKILKEQMGAISKFYLSFTLILLTILGFFYLIIGAFTFAYLIIGLGYFLVLLLLNLLCVLVTIPILRFVTVESMVKNQTMGQGISRLASGTKIVLACLVSASVIGVLTQAKAYEEENKAVLALQDLDGYYTGIGHRTVTDEIIQSSEELIVEVSTQMKKFVTYEDYFLCRAEIISEYDELLQEIRKINYQDLIYDYVIANKKYLDRFASVKADGQTIDFSNYNSPTIFVPQSMQSQEEEILQYADIVYGAKYYSDSSFINVARYWKAVEQYGEETVLQWDYDDFGYIETEQIDHYTVVYIDDDSWVKVNKENIGFEDTFGSLIFLDYGDFSGMTYYGLLAGSIFFDYDSRDDYVATLTRYGIQNYVSAGTYLTPYLQSLADVSILLQLYFSFVVIFLVSLLFVLFIANFVGVLVFRRRFGLMEVMGFSRFWVLRRRLWVWLLELVLVGCLLFVNVFLGWLFVVVLLDVCFCLGVYASLVRGRLYEIVKGA